MEYKHRFTNSIESNASKASVSRIMWHPRWQSPLPPPALGAETHVSTTPS